MTDPRIRNIKIKTGVINRIAKEKLSYEKETEHEKQRLVKQKEEGLDEHVLMKQEEVIQECQQMVPDCVRRLKTAVKDLQSILDTEKDLSETEEYQAAVQAISAAEPHL